VISFAFENSRYFNSRLAIPCFDHNLNIFRFFRCSTSDLIVGSIVFDQAYFRAIPIEGKHPCGRSYYENYELVLRGDQFRTTMFGIIVSYSNTDGPVVVWLINRNDTDEH